jgi:hypothetical protein
MTTKARRRGAPSRPPKDLPPIGRVLRKLRGALSMADAAAKCGRTDDWWHGKEIGRRELSLADLQAIAVGFGVAWHIESSGLVSID